MEKSGRKCVSLSGDVSGSKSALAVETRCSPTHGTSHIRWSCPRTEDKDERRSKQKPPRFNPMGSRLKRVRDGGIVVGIVGDDHVFVWRSGNRLKAYSANCPHLGGPLNQGIVVGESILCPWHHACFNLATGEATAAPAFDASARISRRTFEDNSLQPYNPLCATSACDLSQISATHRLDTMAIVGGGAARFAAADAMRKLGWTRRAITIYLEEGEQPYDRTLLTKDYLEGSFGDERLPIAHHSLTDLGVDFDVGAERSTNRPQK